MIFLSIIKNARRVRARNATASSVIVVLRKLPLIRRRKNNSNYTNADALRRKLTLNNLPYRLLKTKNRRVYKNPAVSFPPCKSG